MTYDAASNRKIRETVSGAMAEPRIVQLAPNLYAVALEVMKIIPAKHIIEQALRDGRIDRDTLVVESSSGNFALGLAVVCREQGLKLRIVGDPAIDPKLRGMLHNLGAEVDIIEKPDALGAYQRLRLARVAQLLGAHPNAFWVQQYDNPGNPDAYRPLAERLLDEMGPAFDLVACVGSGGSSVGLATHLRRHSEQVRVTGVDTFNSVLFGLPDGKRTLRGLGNSIMPKILDHTQFDEIHWLASPQANLAAIELHARHGLFCGPTSGAAYRIASHQAARQPARKTLFVAPDTGYRYQDTIFDARWLKANGEIAGAPCTAPHRVERLDQVDPAREWACFGWGRKSLAEQPGLVALHA
ncbi:cysteine synthase family protein [Burkholderia pseudomallei]|uniref:cysteine synthase family protein n=1 Tax=Burkholderia pseudomallei TaxID=28450 RepID=UPI0003A987A6|nr:cysteine synthase family protein [Burkholderia pseudomallei]ALC56831.1 cysteine synthase [Burkholderia pseudomallei]KGS92770.1 pyridoxal-phosphate dependent enzyme family protein [Burkholderia pseudomallei MSHR7498]KGU65457.1 pyridoxal-phosphate dependent enzyme family protein [Burkholderia pseudomallei MSHR983]KGW20801.1 pyridoxal-phosphate dependent enzyme family protein [Burkholderia pseudomallei MSHR2451]MBD2980083.1 cysteine synthase family protein [Burkholderia pseudomallei]